MEDEKGSCISQSDFARMRQSEQLSLKPSIALYRSSILVELLPSFPNGGKQMRQHQKRRNDGIFPFSRPQPTVTVIVHRG